MRGVEWNDGKLTELEVNIAASTRTCMWLVAGHDAESGCRGEQDFVIVLAPSPIEAARRCAAFHKAQDFDLSPAWQVHPMVNDTTVFTTNRFTEDCGYNGGWSAFQDCFIMVRL